MRPGVPLTVGKQFSDITHRKVGSTRFLRFRYRGSSKHQEELTQDKRFGLPTQLCAMGMDEVRPEVKECLAPSFQAKG